MTILTFSILLLFFSFIAGFLGSLTGLGGGVVVIPVLVLLFHINMHLAMGASLVSVLATSSGSSIAYLRKGYANLRIGLFLETGAIMGALFGALMIPYIPIKYLMILFSLILFLSAYLTISRHEEKEQNRHAHPWALTLKLNGSYPNKKMTETPYVVEHVPLGLFLMSIAGLIAGLLGIGSGTLKVLAMDQALRLPYKVATTTSNFMIGITAAMSTSIYFTHGYISAPIAFPVIIGVILGSYLGAKLLMKIHTRALRFIFSVVISILGLQMLYNALSGAV